MTKEEILKGTGFDLERAKEIHGWLNEGDGRESGSLIRQLEEIWQDFISELNAVCESQVCGAQQYEYARGKSDAIAFAIRKLSGKEVKR